MNKVNITINSRIYTVVADEEERYIRRLCDYVNEKVNLVINEGNHIMGERPLVLAALNICDEYFKLLDTSEPSNNLSELLLKNKQLYSELSDLRKDESNSAREIADLKEQVQLAEKMLEESEQRVQSLEDEIETLGMRIKKQRGEFAIREKELLDMLESK